MSRCALEAVMDKELEFYCLGIVSRLRRGRHFVYLYRVTVDLA